ncbi:MAG TPA: Spy/CpxP family protein refolding chaperone, partial [Gemmatimonadales bacterium]|nr:Spy/CpxP family protein refolding chaperone [Gemmatimonadales bacterium]
MRVLALCAVLLATSAGPLFAQGDSGAPRGPRVRERIEHRFAERLRRELDLTDEQATRLREVAHENGRRRRELRSREHTLRAALDEQLREEAKADQDSVLRLTRELLQLRVEYAESWRREMGELDFLSPVQRARLMVMRERLLHRV